MLHYQGRASNAAFFGGLHHLIALPKRLQQSSSGRAIHSKSGHAQAQHTSGFPLLSLAEASIESLKHLLNFVMSINIMTDDFSELKEQLDQLQEELFLCRQDADRYRTESIALKNFIQTLYENCEKVESDKDSELTLPELLKNLKENIRVFARDHHMRL